MNFLRVNQTTINMQRFPQGIYYFWLFILIANLRLVSSTITVNNGNIYHFVGDSDAGNPDLIRQVRGEPEGECESAPAGYENTKITTDRKWIEAANAASNVYRRNHGVPGFKISEKLCKSAQLWANKLSKGNLDNITHSGWKCGENIWAYEEKESKTPIELGADHPIGEMYSEVEDYDFLMNAGKKKDSIVVNFVQLIWKESRWHCTAMARRSDGLYIVTVSHYWPPGNIPGKYKANVLPPIKIQKLLAKFKGSKMF